MPIYEYECDSCGKTMEFTQRITDPPLTECPECNGRLHKLISLASFQLKGTGWYATDYKKEGGNDGAASPPLASPSNGKDQGDKKKGKEPEQEKRKSYLDQTPDERKSTIKGIVNKVANKI
jgi:putative FmdB family regulatory protein